MNEDPRIAFFDGIADQWDGWEDLPALDRRLAGDLATLGVGAEETVLDLGCGTGNLTRALLGRLAPAGRVVAVDFSPAMIAIARRKVTDPRVAWHVAEARRLPIGSASCDRVFCCSVWPHLDDRAAVARELSRVLRPGGALHVWHLASRARINAIHAGAGAAVRGDVLPPAEDTALLLAGVGFEVVVAEESDVHYLVTAVQPVE